MKRIDLKVHLFGCCVGLMVLSGPSVLRAQMLVKDIWPGPNGSFIKQFTVVSGTLFFTANDSTHFNEIWKSDGTTEGTVLVKDIFPNNTSDPKELTNVNGTLFFTAFESFASLVRKLWKSNGTNDGTVLVKDLADPEQLTNVDGTLFFVQGRELWKSDGTTEGTVLVKEINPGPLGSNPQHLTPVKETLFFIADDGSHGFELWKSDGANEGTTLVKDINAVVGARPYQLTDVEGTLFFVAREGDIHQLWKSDGTKEGTTLVKDTLLVPEDPLGAPNVGASSVPSLTNVDGTLFFVVNDGIHGRELWKSDGTTEGTVLVKDINPGSANATPESLTNVEGRLFFSAFEDTHGVELWTSDGTEGGTVLVKDINPGAQDTAPNTLINAEGILYFSAYDGTGYRLWKSDGTEDGTLLAADLIVSCDTCRFPSVFSVLNGTLLIAAADSTHGKELWAVSVTSTNIEEEIEVPSTYVLSSPYPNPFNPRTQFTLSVAQTQHVEIALYDVLGRRVQRLYNAQLSGTGAHPFVLDGAGLPSGLYLIRVQGDHFHASRMVTLIK